MAIAMVVAGFVLAQASRVQTDLPRSKDGFVTVNSIRLHYVDWGGTGPALLFLTGLGDSAHAFDSLAPSFTSLRSPAASFGW